MEHRLLTFVSTLDISRCRDGRGARERSGDKLELHVVGGVDLLLVSL